MMGVDKIRIFWYNVKMKPKKDGDDRMKHTTKKTLVILTVLAMLVSAVSCGIKRTDESGAPTGTNSSTAGTGTSDQVSTSGTQTQPDSSDNTSSGTLPPVVITDAPVDNTTTAPDTDPVKDDVPPPPSDSTYTQTVNIDSFPDQYNEFLSKTVFVGDSICSGLRVYKILPSDNVMAVGNVGARSIFDYTFNAKGTEYALPDALALLKPEYVVCSMGMNDVNMSSEEKFCANYDNVLAKIHETLPNAKIYVVSITPISAESNFCSNEKLDRYNQALKSHLSGTAYTYLDVASVMKNANNALADENNGGDGIHLSPAAYKAYLKRVCELTVK